MSFFQIIMWRWKLNEIKQCEVRPEPERKQLTTNSDQSTSNSNKFKLIFCFSFNMFLCLIYSRKSSYKQKTNIQVSIDKMATTNCLLFLRFLAIFSVPILTEMIQKKIAKWIS